MVNREERNLNPISSRLIITIKHQDPLDLSKFGAGLKALGEMYAEFSDDRGQLLIKEVRKSSTELELIALGQVLTALDSVTQFGMFVLTVIEFLKSQRREEKEKEEEAEKRLKEEEIEKRLKELEERLEKKAPYGVVFPKVTDSVLKKTGKMADVIDKPEDKVQIVVINELNLNIKGEFNGRDAAQINNNVQAMTKPDRELKKYEKFSFKWVQVNLKSPTAGNKGYIEDIYHKPLKVVFLDDYTKDRMIERTDWHKHSYIVDVLLETVLGVPKTYIILRVYPEDSFIPKDET